MQAFASFGDPQPAGVGLANQARLARAKMLDMPFEDYEREVRSAPSPSRWQSRISR